MVEGVNCEQKTRFNVIKHPLCGRHLVVVRISGELKYVFTVFYNIDNKEEKFLLFSSI
jgi:hypothetical protein